MHAHRPIEYEELVAKEIRRMHMFRETLLFPGTGETSDLITVIDPSPTSRFTCEKRIVSPCASEMPQNWFTKNRGLSIESEAAKCGFHLGMDR